MDLARLEEALRDRERRTIRDGARGRAGVLVPLYGPGPDYRILYTVRSYEVEHHKGEISFPGGASDPGDGSIEETALREGYEEIGVSSDDVAVLGLMDDIMTRTHFSVTPVVGKVLGHPYDFKLLEREVGELLEVPISHLTDASNHVEGFSASDGPVPFVSYRFGEHVIFGATAAMTTQFLSLLQRRS